MAYRKAQHPLCKCGCGQPTERYYNGKRFNNYLAYKGGHRPGTLIDGRRQCRKCLEWKPISEFSRAKRPQGHTIPQSYCKPCSTIVHRERIVKIYGTPRNRHLLKRYRITEEQFNEMNRAQNGICPLCLKRPAVAVDHCHETNKVRGILCHGCNEALGKFGDNLAGAQRVMKYFTG